MRRSEHSLAGKILASAGSSRGRWVPVQRKRCQDSVRGSAACQNQAGGIRVDDATAKLTLQGSTGAKVTQNTGTAPGIHSIALLMPPVGVTATRVTVNFDANLTGCNNYYYDNACVIP